MPRRLEPPYRYLLDECMGMHTVPDALRPSLLEGETLLRFPDVFSRGVKDEVWLRKATDYVIITKDDKLRYRPNERGALIEAGVVVFIVASASALVMAERLVHAMPTIRRVLRGQKPPLVGRVLENGAIALSILDGKPAQKTVKRPIG